MGRRKGKEKGLKREEGGTNGNGMEEEQLHMANVFSALTHAWWAPRYYIYSRGREGAY